MHFFSPANVMRLVEVVRGAESAPDALATALALARRLGKMPAVVGVCYGFVGNRMLARAPVEAERLLLEGALPQEIEAALVEFGFPMGPFAIDGPGRARCRLAEPQGARRTGGDRRCAVRGRAFRPEDRQAAISTTRPARARRCPIPRSSASSSPPRPRLGIARRKIEATEIVERTILPMINEGARILEEGIAARPGDIDVIWVYGYGWPVLARRPDVLRRPDRARGRSGTV